MINKLRETFKEIKSKNNDIEIMEKEIQELKQTKEDSKTFKPLERVRASKDIDQAINYYNEEIRALKSKVEILEKKVKLYSEQAGYSEFVKINEIRDRHQLELTLKIQKLYKESSKKYKEELSKNTFIGFTEYEKEIVESNSLEKIEELFIKGWREEEIYSDVETLKYKKFI